MLAIATIRAHWLLLMCETWAIAKGDLVGQGGTVDAHCLLVVCSGGSREGARGEVPLTFRLC